MRQLLLLYFVGSSLIAAAQSPPVSAEIPVKQTTVIRAGISLFKFQPEMRVLSLPSVGAEHALGRRLSVVGWAETDFNWFDRSYPIVLQGGLLTVGPRYYLGKGFAASAVPQSPQGYYLSLMNSLKINRKPSPGFEPSASAWVAYAEPDALLYWGEQRVYRHLLIDSGIGAGIRSSVYPGLYLGAQRKAAFVLDLNMRFYFVR